MVDIDFTKSAVVAAADRGSITAALRGDIGVDNTDRINVALVAAADRRRVRAGGSRHGRIADRDISRVFITFVAAADRGGVVAAFGVDGTVNDRDGIKRAVYAAADTRAGHIFADQIGKQLDHSKRHIGVLHTGRICHIQPFQLFFDRCRHRVRAVIRFRNGVDLLTAGDGDRAAVAAVFAAADTCAAYHRCRGDLRVCNIDRTCAAVITAADTRAVDGDREYFRISDVDRIFLISVSAAADTRAAFFISRSPDGDLGVRDVDRGIRGVITAADRSSLSYRFCIDFSAVYADRTGRALVIQAGADTRARR